MGSSFLNIFWKADIKPLSNNSNFWAFSETDSDCWFYFLQHGPYFLLSKPHKFWLVVCFCFFLKLKRGHSENKIVFLTRVLLLLFLLLLLFAFFWLQCVTWRILVPLPGFEPTPPSVETCSLNHWTAREVPRFWVLKGTSGIILSHIPTLEMRKLRPQEFHGVMAAGSRVGTKVQHSHLQV